MRLVLHPKVGSDVSRIMEYYEQVATPELADEFYRELRYFIQKVAERPEAFSVRERYSASEFAAISLSSFVSHRRGFSSDSRCPPSHKTSIFRSHAPMRYHETIITGGLFSQTEIS
jgi:plasmid stabilization system protein ParE